MQTGHMRKMKKKELAGSIGYNILSTFIATALPVAYV